MVASQVTLTPDAGEARNPGIPERLGTVRDVAPLIEFPEVEINSRFSVVCVGFQLRLAEYAMVAVCVNPAYEKLNVGRVAGVGPA